MPGYTLVRAAITCSRTWQGRLPPLPDPYNIPKKIGLEIQYGYHIMCFNFSNG
jgi:hypothetical protein